MLMIRENDLETVLANRRNFIGIAPRLESALTIITGVFYVASAVVMEDLWWKIPMYVLGAIVTISGVLGHEMEVLVLPEPSLHSECSG